MSETYDYIKMDKSSEIMDSVKVNNSGVDKCLKGDFQGGISDFTSALEYSPDNSVILENRSTAYTDASIVDTLASFGFTFTGSVTKFYSFFHIFKQRL